MCSMCFIYEENTISSLLLLPQGLTFANCPHQEHMPFLEELMHLDLSIHLAQFWFWFHVLYHVQAHAYF